MLGETSKWKDPNFRETWGSETGNCEVSCQLERSAAYSWQNRTKTIDFRWGGIFDQKKTAGSTIFDDERNEKVLEVVKVGPVEKKVVKVGPVEKKEGTNKIDYNI